MLKVWPLVAVAASPFHSKIPYFVSSVSNHHAPLAGSPVTSVALPVKAPRSTSGLTTYALLATPKYE